MRTRVFPLSFLLALVAICSFGHEARAQIYTCDGQYLVAGEGKDGCPGVGVGPSVGNWPIYDTVPANLVGAGSLDETADLSQALGSGGTVSVSSGEFFYPFVILGLPGMHGGQPLGLRLVYRSFRAEEWDQFWSGGVNVVQDGEAVGTYGSPFGPGWRASFGEMLLDPVLTYDPQTGDVTGGSAQWVDEKGAVWSFVNPQNYVDPYAPLSPGGGVFDPRKGSRLIFDGTNWIRELPDRTRIEYAARVPGSSNNWRISRIYRGDPSNPAWQYTYNYDNQTHKGLTQIQTPRGNVVQFAWVDQDPGSGTAYRITSIQVSAPTGWSLPATQTLFSYETSAPYRLSKVSRPATNFVFDLDGDGSYGGTETFNSKSPTTAFVYVPNGNRLTKVLWHKDSFGSASDLQWLENEYDSTSGKT